MVERLKQWREERREDRLERSRSQPIRPGAMASGGGLGFKLLAVAILVGLVVVFVVVVRDYLS